MNLGARWLLKEDRRLGKTQRLMPVYRPSNLAYHRFARTISASYLGPSLVARSIMGNRTVGSVCAVRLR